MSDTYLSGGLMSVLWSRIKNLVSTKENKFSVLSIDKGGTGGSTSEEAMGNLISSLPQFTGAYYYSDVWIPVYSKLRESEPDKYPERTGYRNLAGFMSTITNRSTGVHQTDTNYGTYMARGIAISQSIPDEMVNGTAAFVYTS